MRVVVRVVEGRVEPLELQTVEEVREVMLTGQVEQTVQMV